MATKTDLANFALGHIGDVVITDVDSPTNEAGRTVNLWFDTARRRVLRLANWNCCAKRVELAADATAPVYGYNFRYLLPGDFIRFVKMNYSGAGLEAAIESGYVLTNKSSPIFIKYVFDELDVSKFDEDLVQAVAFMLAYYISPKLTQSNTKRTELREAAYDEVTRAKDVDTSGQAPQLIAGGSWVRGFSGQRDPTKWWG